MENVEIEKTETNHVMDPRAEEQKFIAYGVIFNQLLQSEKFRMFMDTYFTVQKMIDEEEKMITFQVIENPPEVIMKKITAAAEASGAMQAAQTMPKKAKKAGIQIVGADMGKKILDQAKADAMKSRKHR